MADNNGDIKGRVDAFLNSTVSAFVTEIKYDQAETPFLSYETAATQRTESQAKT